MSKRAEDMGGDDDPEYNFQHLGVYLSHAVVTEVERRHPADRQCEKKEVKRSVGAFGCKGQDVRFLGGAEGVP